MTNDKNSNGIVKTVKIAGSLVGILIFLFVIVKVFVLDNYRLGEVEAQADSVETIAHKNKDDIIEFRTEQKHIRKTVDNLDTKFDILLKKLT